MELLVILLVLYAWVVTCNVRTRRQRLRIIWEFPMGDGYDAADRDFNAVPYERHLWTLARFGDWRALYSQRLRDACPEAFNERNTP
jgi:hypothetical protein